METFEFLVTSTVQATLYEHIKIQALNYEDAVTRIKDRDYYEEDGEFYNYQDMQKRDTTVVTRCNN